MLRLLHTADVHLGAKFLSLGDKGTAQREQVRASFKKLVSLAVAEDIDIVLIAGDLFDANQQPQRNIDLVVEQFGLLAAKNIPVCIIPGTHDCFDSGSIYRKVNFLERCPNLTVFTGEGWEYKEFSALRLTVYGKANRSNRSYNSPLEGLKRSTESQYHVAMAHGSLNIPGAIAEDDHVFNKDQIQGSQMHYVALGHWHRPYACCDWGVIAWYSGPPELISMDQKEPGSALIVTILDSGKVEVEARQIGLRCCDELEIDLSDLESLSQLKSKIVEGAKLSLVRQVILKGLRNEDMRLSLEELEAELSESFFHLRITDRSHPRMSELSEDAYEDQLIVAKFIKLMKEHIQMCEGEDRELAEEALQYGLALLQGKEVI
jgi:DNA repair exonuclease SbcCD nuclease subunit